MIAILFPEGYLKNLIYLFLHDFHFGGFYFIYITNYPYPPFPVPHIMNIIPIFKKNMIAHNILIIWSRNLEKIFDFWLQVLGQEVSNPGLQLLVVPESIQEPC